MVEDTVTHDDGVENGAEDAQADRDPPVARVHYSLYQQGHPVHKSKATWKIEKQRKDKQTNRQTNKQTEKQGPF